MYQRGSQGISETIPSDDECLMQSSKSNVAEGPGFSLFYEFSSVCAIKVGFMCNMWLFHRHSFFFRSRFHFINIHIIVLSFPLGGHSKVRALNLSIFGPLPPCEPLPLVHSCMFLRYPLLLSIRTFK